MSSSDAIALSPNEARKWWPDFVEIVFVRLLALVFVWLAIQTWLTIIGFADGIERFDVQSAPWRTYLATLGVLQPVAAVGLWTALSWGRVVWFLALIAQFVAWTFYPAVFPLEKGLMLFHLGTVICWLLLVIARSVTAKKG